MKVFACIVAFLLAGISIARIAMPEDMIYMRYHRWFQDAEPTELHIRGERICGIIGILAAVIILIIAFTQ